MFVKFNEFGSIVYAPNTLILNEEEIQNPTDEMYLQSGYKYYVNLIPDEGEGHNFKTEYTEDDTTITCNWIPEYIVLDELKLGKIKKSKKMLAEFLETHPLFSYAKYNDGRYYTVTSEKQQQITGKILMTNINPNYVLTWNDTGNVCEVWELTQLIQLGIEMDTYVTPLVAKQQKYEIAVKNAVTIDEVKAIKICYEDETN